ncbi:MAG: hypothetical protein A2836_02455 [Candidatus Taylorbacteria bacterium RIFCSPHIGHO2_01_FULL_45_63]|uniref:Uncharacterized protein n=1 Tax=Candidatus Taylorbacteria bacterium RIFCSPHIGHO2_02_FULL_45_35 TaxID=1802311 RepID=A0A1G2MRU4_9BACT|nr:MAG: hypothetical protein A2836_02455 [Candidatus Taylorbacteria bacterium RIFCSPHIGHO2_01_FULL_45_63]OHA26578.1 MAG: hypothetical protein A3D56_03050 [Candidatus Taylorbacteria bacterium RIFCSPHIGHO2_02_FULL_45_35]OHA33273.1 MAG: hypothetical protein A3A22_01675 [Candidatus Taylorbacteria bacterium RIFCSPLOWO2_01_FULL_45_34b]
MSYIQKCRYCKETCVDAEYHIECRLAHLETVLAIIQTSFKTGKVIGLPREVWLLLHKEKFSSRTLPPAKVETLASEPNPVREIDARKPNDHKGELLGAIFNFQGECRPR